MTMPEPLTSPSPAPSRGAELDLESLREAARAAQSALVALPCEPGRIVRVEACPGSGKTQTIIDRHLNRPLAPRQGRAVVSFTKAAAAEVAQRCVREGRPELATYPHFIGTFDSFVWTHVVRPHIKPRPGQRWRRLESWNDHPKARQEGVSLEDFHFAQNSKQRVRIANPRWKKPPYWLNRDPGRAQRALHKAGQRISELWAEGFMAGDQLRDIALYMLTSEERGPGIAALLASRFTEVIVDESQDLSSEDRSILRLLSGRDVPLLTVGDPDQRIYGFREAPVTPASPLASTQASAPDLRLSHNWRSTQIICDLAQTLRPSGTPADIAVGDHRREDTPVLLLGTSGSRLAKVILPFEEEADRIGVRDPAQRMVLAYQRATLASAFTKVKEEPPSAQLGALVWATAILRSPGVERKQRESAEKIFSETIRRHWLGDVDVPEAEHLERHGLTALELRTASRLLLHTLPSLDEPAGEWSRESFRALSVLPMGHVRTAVAKRSFPCDQAKKEKPAFGLVGSAAQERNQARTSRSNTIHGVKGEQFDAVLVHAPDGLIATWASGRRTSIGDEAAEVLRVYYVAATRARRLLAFAVNQDQIPHLQRYLTAQNVPVEVR
ncbi:UvrD-helicase domain-containing protein [Streptomyces californicus]|uniref:UvrD-helicase domain-containing protein n=1 Tax=Streptomyces californicus TaxID=67351 RepID=UPI000996E403